MTPAQRKALESFDKAGLYYPLSGNYGNHVRMIERMIKIGWVKTYRHGGYEITAAGKDALAELKKDGVPE